MLVFSYSNRIAILSIMLKRGFSAKTFYLVSKYWLRKSSGSRLQNKITLETPASGFFAMIISYSPEIIR
jgi:hypothetical protein